jgi:hypothetical protein
MDGQQKFDDELCGTKTWLLDKGQNRFWKNP